MWAFAYDLNSELLLWIALTNTVTTRGYVEEIWGNCLCLSSTRARANQNARCSFVIIFVRVVVSLLTRTPLREDLYKMEGSHHGLHGNVPEHGLEILAPGLAAIDGGHLCRACLPEAAASFLEGLNVVEWLEEAEHLSTVLDGVSMLQEPQFKLFPNARTIQIEEVRQFISCHMVVGHGTTQIVKYKFLGTLCLGWDNQTVSAVLSHSL